MIFKKKYCIFYRLSFTIRIEFDDLHVKVEILDMNLIVFMSYEFHSLYNIKATLIALQAFFESISITKTCS